MERTFTALDYGQDGEIDSDDLRQVFGDNVSQIDDERWQRITNKVDASGDGKIQFDEFKTYMMRMMKDELRKSSSEMHEETNR